MIMLEEDGSIFKYNRSKKHLKARFVTYVDAKNGLLEKIAA